MKLFGADTNSGMIQKISDSFGNEFQSEIVRIIPEFVSDSDNFGLKFIPNQYEIFRIIPEFVSERNSFIPI